MAIAIVSYLRKNIQPRHQPPVCVQLDGLIAFGTSEEIRWSVLHFDCLECQTDRTGFMLSE